MRLLPGGNVLVPAVCNTLQSLYAPNATASLSFGSSEQRYIHLCWWGQDRRHGLAVHTINSNTHIARMLSHDKAIVLIQIKHGVFDCKVHKLKRHVKVGLFRMVTHNYTPFCKFCPIPIRIFYPEKPSIPVTNAVTVYILNSCECIVRPLNPSLVTGWTCNIAHVCLA